MPDIWEEYFLHVTSLPNSDNLIVTIHLQTMEAVSYYNTLWNMHNANCESRYHISHQILTGVVICHDVYERKHSKQEVFYAASWTLTFWYFAFHDFFKWRRCWNYSIIIFIEWFLWEDRSFYQDLWQYSVVRFMQKLVNLFLRLLWI